MTIYILVWAIWLDRLKTIIIVPDYTTNQVVLYQPRFLLSLISKQQASTKELAKQTIDNHCSVWIYVQVNSELWKLIEIYYDKKKSFIINIHIHVKK